MHLNKQIHICEAVRSVSINYISINYALIRIYIYIDELIRFKMRARTHTQTPLDMNIIFNV